MLEKWDDVRVFLAVARVESLSGAAKQLKIDPATVGRRIARLEDALGVVVFAKSPQGYALTDAGSRLLGHAERMEAAMTAARADIGGDAEQLTGQIRVGAPDGCANYILPQVCAAISDANPGLEVQILALPRVFNLSKREADMAIAISPPSSGRLTVQKITDYKLHLAAHKRYLRSANPLTSLEDLRHHRIVGYIPDLIFDKELDYLAEAGVERADLESNSVPVQINFLKNAAGVGIMHDFAIPSARGLVKVLEDEFSLTRTFHLIRHADDRRVERLNRFGSLLVDGIRRETSRLEALA